MGVLDNKSRIVDTVITEAGRESLARGDFDISYYSFSDSGVHYDIFTGSRGQLVVDDAAAGFFPEAPSALAHDIMYFRSNDAGGVDRPAVDGYYLANGSIAVRLVSGTVELTSSYDSPLTPIAGTQFSSFAQHAIADNYRNVEKHRLIKSSNPLFADSYFQEQSQLVFSLSTDNSGTPSQPADGKVLLRFDYPTPERLFGPTYNGLHAVDLRQVSDVRHDKRFSDIDNFLYLPPTRKLSKNEKAGLQEYTSKTKDAYSSISANINLTDPANGDYWFKLQDTSVTSFNLPLSSDDIVGNSAGIVDQLIHYNGTQKSRANGATTVWKSISHPYPRLAFQVFEVNATEGRMKVLDILDPGPIKNPDGSQYNKRIFFAGKVVFDSGNRPIFLSILTLAFGRSEEEEE